MINGYSGYIVFFISKTKKKMIKFIEGKLKEHDLDDLVPSYGNILRALYENGGKLTMKEIGNLIGKDKSTITVLINRLEGLGYISKESCINDRRVTFIALTEKGRIIESKFEAISNEVYKTAYKGFTDEEKETFLKLLKRMNNNFDNKSV